MSDKLNIMSTVYDELKVGSKDKESNKKKDKGIMIPDLETRLELNKLYNNIGYYIKGMIYNSQVYVREEFLNIINCDVDNIITDLVLDNHIRIIKNKLEIDTEEKKILECMDKPFAIYEDNVYIEAKSELLTLVYQYKELLLSSVKDQLYRILKDNNLGKKKIKKIIKNLKILPYKYYDIIQQNYDFLIDIDEFSLTDKSIHEDSINYYILINKPYIID